MGHKKSSEKLGQEPKKKKKIKIHSTVCTECEKLISFCYQLLLPPPFLHTFAEIKINP